jgi:deoxyadenosine/deoxycytidine kinase
MDMSLRSGIVVECEGNISSGKSTLLRDMCRLRNDALAYAEPVHETFLGAMYADPKQYAFAFQM